MWDEDAIQHHTIQSYVGIHARTKCQKPRTKMVENKLILFATVLLCIMFCQCPATETPIIYIYSVGLNWR